jgi:hypothetical protein
MLAANAPIVLDFTTLIISGTCITALLGLFLLLAWVQERIRALAWWGAPICWEDSQWQSGASRTSSRRRFRPAQPMRFCSSPAV